MRNQRQRTLFEFAAARAARPPRSAPVVIDLEADEDSEHDTNDRPTPAQPILIDDDDDDNDDDDNDDNGNDDNDDVATRVVAPVDPVGPAHQLEVEAKVSVAELPLLKPASPKPSCPLCGVSLAALELHLRELHCDQCADIKKTSPPLPKPKRPRKPLPPLPSVKKVHFRNFSIAVDGFNFADAPPISQYFLSHFHADHYIGLKKSWSQGAIYCSTVTAQLLTLKLRVPPEIIVELPLDTPFEIGPNVSVICLDANHCPGATVFLFHETDHLDRSRTRQWVLHTGDFRSNNALIDRILAYTHGESIHKVYLDTTYMYPSYHFPLQPSVLQVTSEFAGQINEVGARKLFNNRQSSILSYVTASLSRRHIYNYVFVVGTYTIGKEKLAVAIAQWLDTKIFLPKDSPKDRIVQVYQHLLPQDIFTYDITKACVHLVPMRTLSSKDSLNNYFKPIAHIYKDMIAFIPTGWTFSNGGRFVKLYETPQEKIDHTRALMQDAQVDKFNSEVIFKQYKPLAKFQVFKVPYSEHSSFKDLANFCIRVPWVQIVPTVNTHNDYMVNQMKEWFSTWKKIQSLNS